MKLICDLLEIGLRLQLNNADAKFKEIWLAEAMTASWDVWIRMGWSGEQEQCIRTSDWSSFIVSADKNAVMDMISRLNRISRENRINVLHQYDQGWVLILEIAAEINRNGFWFERSPEVNFFRKTVAFFITFGIKRGCNSTSPCAHEQFIFPVRQILFDSPTRTLPEFEIEMDMGQSQTTVSISDPIKLDFHANSHAFYVTSI